MKNLPVVINESFVLRVPVLATRVGGIAEIVNRNNGSLVEAGDEAALEKELKLFLQSKRTYNNKTLKSDSRETFYPNVIGHELCDIYQSIV